MPTLTVDFAPERPTYHLRRADGTEQTSTARSRESAEGVINFYQYRGYTIKRKGHKMPLSKDQQREQRHRFVKALAQVQDTGMITGRGSKNLIKSMERQGLVVTRLPTNYVDMTDAGRALLSQYDPPSATLVNNHAAESSDVGVTWFKSEEEHDKFFADLRGEEEEEKAEAEQLLTLDELNRIFGMLGDDDTQPEPQPEPVAEQPPTPIYYSAPVRDSLRAIRDVTQSAMINLAVHRPTESIYQIGSVLLEVNKLLDAY